MQASHSARFVMEAQSPSGALIRCGGLQNWTVSESVALTRIGEIGRDEYLEIVQGLVDTNISVDILAIAQKMVYQVLAQTYFALKSQHGFFLLREFEKLPNGEVLDIQYHGCKIESTSKTVTSPDQGVTISQNATVQVTYTTVNQAPDFSDILGSDEIAEAAQLTSYGPLNNSDYTPADDLIS